MRNYRRKANSSPVCWILFSITMTFVIFRMVQAQPSAYFKANAPVAKSLPRIGRRSDLDTFPLPLPSPLSQPFATGSGSGRQPLSENGGLNMNSKIWPEINYYLNEKQQQQREKERGREISSIPFLEVDHITPNFWRKLLGDPEVSEGFSGRNGNMEMPDDGSTRNIYRSRSKK